VKLSKLNIMKYEYDLFVIGAGSGGVRAARVSASLGAKVAIAEDTYMGGTCVNVGCIPKKLFVYSSHFHEEIQAAYSYGWNISQTNFEWGRLINNKNNEIHRLNKIYENLLESSGVTIIDGHATIKSSHKIEINGNIYTAKNILIATGSESVVPDIPGNTLGITSDDAFYLESLPEHIVIIGGGYIAVEFAGIFNGLGVDTHLIYRDSLFLRGFDEGIRRFIANEMTQKGINLHFGIDVTEISESKDKKIISLSKGENILTDTVFFATGRRPKTSTLNLEGIGIEIGANAEVLVNAQYQTNIENVYALGDVIDKFQLTPVAIAEAMIVSDNLFGQQQARSLNYSNIPTAIFTQPNIGTVGPTEEEARKTISDLKVFESEFRPLKYTLTETNERSLMKLLVDNSNDKVIAAHMVGPDAGEIIQGISVAIMAGATKDIFDSTVGIHPTAAEEFVTMRSVVR